jgi:hypothetical protein
MIPRARTLTAVLAAQEVAQRAAAVPGKAGQPPVLVEPKIPPGARGGLGMPSFLTRAAPGREQRLRETDRRVATTDLLSYRGLRTTKETIRQLSSTSADMSASVHAYTRLVVTQGYRAIARNQDSTPNVEATQALQILLARFDYLAGYSDGFSGVNSIHSLAESLMRELRIEGACALELVLDKARLPERLQPISVSQIEFLDDGKTKYRRPVQVIGGEDIDLDYPTFFYESLDQDLLEAYSSSPMEAAVQATMADTEFTNDVRRIIKRALHPRLTAIIQSDQFVKSVPPEIQADPERLDEYRAQVIAAVESEINGLEPDDALVAFDTIKFDLMGRGNESLGREYETLQAINDAKVASGTKAPGSVLGHASGSQNIASTESMLFVKYCQGMQTKINTILSRALTLAARLLGHDCYVEFAFDRIDLRPDSELEAYQAMKQSRVLELLSLGMISDEEACIDLTGRLPPAGAPRLSGTFFRATNQAPDIVENPNSNTSALNKDLTPSTPDQPKGAPIRRVQ